MTLTIPAYRGDKCVARPPREEALDAWGARKRKHVRLRRPCLSVCLSPTAKRKNDGICKAWAAATRAPVDPDPLRQTKEPNQYYERQLSPETSVPLLSPSEFSLVLRPDIGSDEHLLPIHESPWTPDGKAWFQAKISLLQDDAPSAVAGTAAGGGGVAGGLGAPHHEEQPREGSAEKNVSDQDLGGGAGLSVTLRPEGAGQRRLRLEREAAAAMAVEDERSRRVGEGMSRLEKEAAGRARVVEERSRAANLAATLFTAKVGDRWMSAASRLQK